jgi:alanine racemase
VKSWVEISGELLRDNYHLLQQAAGEGTAVLAVLKADAYGHGLEVSAPVLAQAGAEWLGVGGVEEGMTLRRALAAAGIDEAQQPRILVMCGHSHEDAEGIIDAELTPVIWRTEQVAWLHEAAQRLATKSTLPVHVEIDSGMTRQGARPGSELAAILEALRKSRELRGTGALRLDGVMTHFASGEVAGSAQTVEQQLTFEAALAQVHEAGFLPEWIHAGSTSSVDVELTRQAEDTIAWLRRTAANSNATPMVRTGIALHGYCLPMEQTGVQPATERLARHLRPAMTWKAKIIDVRDVQPGDAVGYNGTFIAEQPMRLALLEIGYADGLRRELSSTNGNSGGWVMIHDQRAPIIGRISMNLTSVDVTNIVGATTGDEAVVLGEGITAEDHARLANTVVYEIVCGVRAVARLV